MSNIFNHDFIDFFKALNTARVKVCPPPMDKQLFELRKRPAERGL
jgi:hypothetical protein